MDYMKLLPLANKGKEAIGAALDREGQLFVSQHYPYLADFMNTVQGREAIRTFVNSWAHTVLAARNVNTEPPPIPALVQVPKE